jgi:predicted DNA-binding protein (MmcQ/YjbR family)
LSADRRLEWELFKKEMEETHSKLWTFKHAIEFKREQQQLMWAHVKQRYAEETQEDDPVALSLKSQIEGIVKIIDMCMIPSPAFHMHTAHHMPCSKPNKSYECMVYRF